MVVITLSTCPDWEPWKTDEVFAIASTYEEGEDYFGKVQTLFDTIGIPIGHPFDVVCWPFSISMNEDERERFDFELKSGKTVSGRNKRRDINNWISKIARKVKNELPRT